MERTNTDGHRKKRDMSGFVHFYSKRGVAYAEWRVSVRRGATVSHERRTLGRVIDRERLIFKRRKGQPYGINADGTPRDLTPDELATIAARDDATAAATLGAEHDPLDFGDAFFIVTYLRQLGLAQIIEGLVEDRADAALCLLVHQTLYPGDNLDCVAAWWKGSYACYLFDEAALDAQGIRACLEGLGRPGIRERLLRACVELSQDEDGRLPAAQAGAVAPSPCGAAAAMAAGRQTLVDLATAVRAHLQRDLIRRLPSRHVSDASVALMLLRNHKARVYDRAIVPLPPAPENAALYDAFGIEVPACVPWEDADPRLALGANAILGDGLEA